MERATPATPCQVHRVLVRGAQHTHESVVTQELRALGAATTLGEIHQACALAAARLESLTVFESAEFTVDRARADGAAGDMPLADVIVTVSEKKRLASASTGVHTSGGEGSMDAEVSVRNVFGYAERLGAHMEAGQHKSNTFRLHATKPRPWGTESYLRAELAKTVCSHQKVSSFTEKSYAAFLTAGAGHASLPGGAHDFTYEMALRRVTEVPVRTCSWAVLQQQAISVKSSLKHTYTRSTLDDPLVPMSGHLLKLITEVAGLGGLGDAAFHKHTAEARSQLPLSAVGLPSFSLGCSASIGLILPLHRATPQTPAAHGAARAAASTGGCCSSAGGSASSSIFGSGAADRQGYPPPARRSSPEPSRRPGAVAAASHLPPPQPLLPPPGVTICDRFFLGGAHSLWGFRTNGVGPREQRHTASGLVNPRTPSDALGGDVLLSATVDLTGRLPGELPERAGARFRIFGSAGALHSLGAISAAVGEGPNATAGAAARAVGAGMRAVVGAGLVFPTPLGRLELNLTHVLRAMPGDAVVRNGIQIGVSGPAC